MIDYKEVFKNLPASYILVKPSGDKFIIRDITLFHAQILGIKREDVLDKDLFEVFPDNPLQEWKNSEQLLNSFKEVIKTKRPHILSQLRYDVPKEGITNFETRFWRIENYPLLDSDNEVKFIINSAIDITEIMKFILKEE